MSLLDVHAADSFYGDFQALFDVSMSVDEGETVAMIGANGAGKSTLLRLIAGLLPVLDGDLMYDGRSIARLPAYDRVALGISLVPEGRHVFPSLTVEENLLIGRYRKRDGPWNMHRVKELFPMLGLLGGRSAAVLSGGEQQALAIGRSLMANPRLLLLDEVSLGLAPVIVKQVYAALPAIRSEGTTILLVEQNIEQALGAADRIYCLLEGRVSLEGRPAGMEKSAITAAYFGI